MKKRREVEIPVIMLQYGVDLIDLIILNQMNNGPFADHPTLYEEYKKALFENISTECKDKGYRISDDEIQRRIDKMKKNKIILKEHSVIVDITKLYNHVYHLYIKLPLYGGAVRGVIRETMDWKEGMQRVLEVNRKYGIIRYMWAYEGDGEYDLICLVSSPDMETHAKFISDLTKLGIAEKTKTQRCSRPFGVYVDPISIPSIEDYSKKLDYFKKLKYTS